MTIVIDSIHYYPVKGLSGTTLTRADIDARGLAHDRRFGLAFAEYDQLLDGRAAWRPWNYFISLKKQTRPVNLFAAVDDDGDAALLTLRSSDGDCISGNPADAVQRRRLETFIGDYLQCPPPRLIDSSEVRLWDERDAALSFVNSASVAALAQDSGMPIDNARFRANIVFSAPAWQEEQWRGNITIADVALTLTGGIPRCAATTVNTRSAQRDCNPPQLLLDMRGSNALGVYAAVQRGGHISAGLEINLESSA